MTDSTTKPAAPAVRREEYMVDPSLIMKVEGHNPRFDFGDIEALAGQIEEQHKLDGVGILTALVLKRSGIQPGHFELVSGERRLMAVRLLMEKGIAFSKGIPAKLMDKGTSKLAALLRDFISNGAKPLLPLEEAQGYARLQAGDAEAGDAPMTIEAIAKAVGRNHVHVWTALQHQKADPSVIGALKDGTINASLAKEIATKATGDADAQREMVADIKAAGKDKKKLAAAKKAAKGKARAAQEKRVEKKTATGAKTRLKIRALDDSQLGELGAKMAKHLESLLADAGVATGEALLAACSGDNKLAACYTLGVLHALRAAAGEKINLKL